MERIEFNKCLNKETKVWNIPLYSLIGGGLVGIIFCLIKGMLWGIGFGAIGFIFGGWISKQLWLGNFQRWIYWNLPLNPLMVNKFVPPSHQRNLI